MRMAPDKGFNDTWGAALSLEVVFSGKLVTAGNITASVDLHARGDQPGWPAGESRRAITGEFSSSDPSFLGGSGGLLSSERCREREV